MLKNLVLLRVRTTDCDQYGVVERFWAPFQAAAAHGLTGEEGACSEYLGIKKHGKNPLRKPS